MTTATRKYYVMVPPGFSYNEKTYWHELLGVKSLTSAQHYVSEVFSGLAGAEIWAPREGGIMRVVSKRLADGKWEIIYDHKTDVDEPANSYYHLGGHRFARSDFFKYGFQHEKGNVAGHNTNINIYQTFD